MKILGIGVDMVKVSRIEHILSKNYARRFLTKVLHTEEIEFLDKQEN